MAGIEAKDGMINLTEIFSDPEKVRLLLIENGVEKEVLDLLDDNQLMELTKTYLETTIQGGEVQKELKRFRTRDASCGNCLDWWRFKNC